MRGTLQRSKRVAPEAVSCFASRQGLKRNVHGSRRHAACFLLMLACVLLVGCANATWSMEAQPASNLVDDTDSMSTQPEELTAPAITPPMADQDPEPPVEEQEPDDQDPEPPAENQDSELPSENQDPEDPDQAPEDPTQNTGEPVQPSEDPDQTVQEVPAAPEDAPPVFGDQEKLDEQVQKVLDGIITDGMTKLEQAKAVWDFTKNGISYTGSSDKTDWMSGAYEGLATRKGDCFTYYAVSRALLTALEIDNIEVRRVGGITSHYWNLVNCGDGWYHFDATPRSSKLPYFVSFMFTDEEAADYTARVGEGREYYTFDGSLYPERGTGDPAADLSD